MSSYIIQKAYIPNASKYAEKIGITRQYLSLIVHNEEKHKGHWVLKAYKELKEKQTAV